jgi:poly(beta-D-mannuronate) lyase
MKKISVLSIFILFAGVLVLQARDYSFSPTQIPALKQLLGSGELQPGDRVILQDGVYTGWDRFEFYGRGTSEAPITLTAQNPGKAILSGAMNLRIYGTYLTVDGLVFYEAWAIGHDLIDFRKEQGNCAYNSRMTNCVIDTCNDPATAQSNSEYWVGVRGKNNRVDHCYFARKKVAGLIVQVWLEEESYRNNHRIDHNFFGERPPFGGNGAEIIRIGHSWSSQNPSCTVVEDNVFYHCDGENETVSVKSCENTVRRNLFYETRGSITLRHGHDNVIESNVFIGNGIKGTMGIRVINQGHKVYNNYMQDITGRGSDAALTVRMGVYERPTPETDPKKEPFTSYHRVVDADIAYNTFVNCAQIDLGQGSGDKEPRNVRFANNLIYNPDAGTNITISNPAVFPGIKCFNNYVAFRKGSNFALEGFTPAPVRFEKQESGDFKGFYRLVTDFRLNAGTGFDYIRTDAAGTQRTGGDNAGAVLLSARNRKFAAAKPADCGPAWYGHLQSAVRDIMQKAAF